MGRQSINDDVSDFNPIIIIVVCCFGAHCLFESVVITACLYAAASGTVNTVVYSLITQTVEQQNLGGLNENEMKIIMKKKNLFDFF